MDAEAELQNKTKLRDIVYNAMGRHCYEIPVTLVNVYECS